MSALAQTTAQNQTLASQQQTIQEPEYPEFENQLIRKPKEIIAIWNSQQPKEDMAALFTRFVKTNVEIQGSEVNAYNEFENMYEPEEVSIIGEFCLQILVFLKGDVKADDYATTTLLNRYMEGIPLFKKYMAATQIAHFAVTETGMKTVQELFNSKHLTREQCKQVIEYTKVTFIKHADLLELFFANKRVQVDKCIKITIPQQQFAMGLEPGCNEIVEHKPEEFNPNRSQSEFHEGEGEQKEESDVESEVDPDDPLYGLNQRLRNMNLDDESMKIIKEKLEEANSRIKVALEDRQRNLDSKLAGDKNAPKKK